MGWDQTLNPDQIKVIRDILVDLQRVDEFFFPRHILYEHTELHVFTDASSRAYGAAVYTVNDTCTHSSLLMSKARVAPCKEGRLTIPKLELTASLIGARLIHYLTNLFKFQAIYLWSDSKVAISWITSEGDIKDMYVANRTAEIETLINQHQVRIMYVPTKNNPADYLSRGCTSKQLKSSNWLHGPSWLLTREFPEQTSTNIVVNELTIEINPIHPIQPLIDLTKFNSYIRVMRIMIRVLEFCQSPANPFEKLVRQEQLLHCTSIHAHLTNNRVNVNVEVKTTIKQLNLCLENDTIRAKGRIINSELPLDATTPLFLPNKSHLVDLLINHIHSSHHHVGLSQTLSLYKQRCWTPKICSCIKSLLLRCVTCQKIKGRTLPRPLPPPLPAERVRWVAPFKHVGVDHTGSFTIKDTQGRKNKAYICLFVCATTRAVHLEVVDNLTAASFIMCLRRLAAAKGMPTLILSDNHKTFVTQPLYESRMYWIHDPAPPTSRRPNLEFAGTPAPAIAKEFPGALSTQPKHKKSRRRKATRTANQNAACRSTAPVTPDDRWTNNNSASQRATRPKSAANDLPKMRSTPVEHHNSFHSSHMTQPPIPAANENSELSFGLDHCEFSGLYKPAQINPRQDLTATPTRVNSSGFGLSSPAPKQPYTKPFSGLPSGRKVTSPLREAGEAHGERPGIVYLLLPRATCPDTKLAIDAAALPESAALSRQARPPTVLDLEEEPREKENQPPSQSRYQLSNRLTGVYRPSKSLPPRGRWCE